MNTLNTIFLFAIISLFGSVNLPQASLLSIDEKILLVSSEDAIQVYEAIQDLKSYDFSAFTDQHRVKLNSYLLEETPHLNQLIELCGFLRMKEELLAFAQNKKLPKRIIEKLNYALVRAGDDAKLRVMMKNLKKQKLNDDFAYNLSTILVYTRQKEVFDHLLDRIMDDSKSCNHSDMDTPGKYTCAYALINSITPYINEFPIEYDEYGVKSDNPQQTLRQVRQWISSNKETYTLNTNKY